MDRSCKVSGCSAKHAARGWCKRHYYRWKRNGDPVADRPRRSDWTRFQEKFRAVDNGCWQWTAAHVPAGYGTFSVMGKPCIAIRWSWEHAYGPIPDGMYIDHFLFPDRCIGPACVNPAHLRPVTPRESVLRSESASAINLAKTHCTRGHAFTPGNTRMYRNQRRCRECARIHNRRYAQRRQPKAA